MTTITASEYSPNSPPAQPLSALDPGQVALLNRGKAHDISQRVRTVVQRHLGYQGREVFRTTFTKQEITFTLRNGPAAENRTLKLQNGHWMFSQNTAPAAPLDPAVEDEVNTLVTEILANIGQASRANAPDPVNDAAAVDAVDADVPAANAAELVQIRERLAALEAQLRANPTLERSLEVQQRTLDELGDLRTSLERHPPAGTEERDALRGQVDQLQHALAEEGRKNERTLAQQREESEQAMRAGQARLEALEADLDKAGQELKKLQQALGEKDQAAVAIQQRVAALETEQRQLGGELEASKSQVATVSQQKESLQAQLAAARQDLEKLQQDLAEKDKATAALQEKVTELEATVSQKDVEQKRALEEFKAFKAEKESIQKQLQAQVQAADERVLKLEQAAKEAAAQNNRNVTALREQQASLEQQLAAVRSELDQLKQTNQKDLANASSQLEALRTQKTTLEAKLGASTEEAKSANTKLSQRIGELENQIQAQQAQLASDERINKSQAAVIARQEQQAERVKSLESALTETRIAAQLKMLQEKFRTIQHHLQKMHQARQTEVAATGEYQTAFPKAAVIKHEEVNQLYSAIPRTRSAGVDSKVPQARQPGVAAATRVYQTTVRNTAFVKNEEVNRLNPTTPRARNAAVDSEVAKLGWTDL